MITRGGRPRPRPLGGWHRASTASRLPVVLSTATTWPLSSTAHTVGGTPRVGYGGVKVRHTAGEGSWVCRTAVWVSTSHSRRLHPEPRASNGWLPWLAPHMGPGWATAAAEWPPGFALPLLSREGGAPWRVGGAVSTAVHAHSIPLGRGV